MTSFRFVAIVVGLASAFAFGSAPRWASAQVSRDRPFSFLIDGAAASTRLVSARGGGWRDRNGGLIVTADVVRHADFGATEWTLRLRNDGNARSPLLSDIWSADVEVDVDPDSPGPQLFTSEGSSDKPSDFKPTLQLLAVGKPVALATFGGRSSDGVMPYFNVFGGRRGSIVAVGWTGDWKAEIVTTTPGKVRVRIGMQRANFRLEPGESVRMPAILMMPWTGERIDAHNKFRRLMLAHYTPANHPPMELAPIGVSPYLKIAFNDVTEANLRAFIQTMHDAKIGFDTMWVDAGWNLGGFPDKTGNPEPDPARFPNGLKPVADLAHKLGYRYVQWFEPERVMVGTSLANEHPDWMLEGSDFTPAVAYQKTFRLLDLGNPAARAWTLEYLARHIQTSGIDVYRQDFNMYPSFFWQHEEPADRVGIREIRYVEGEYELLDALQKKFPKLVIDNCASGGRRLDFEMMKRSVPLWRTDCVWGRPGYPRSAQAMTYGISFWLPIHGIGTTSPDLESFASGLAATYQMALDFHDPAVLEAIRPLVEKMKRVRPFMIADFYPLTDYSLDPKTTIAVQFHDVKSDSGVILVFGETIDLSKIHPMALRASRFEWTDWAASDKASDAASTRVSRADLQRTGLPSLVGDAPRKVVVLEYKPSK